MNICADSQHSHFEVDFCEENAGLDIMLGREHWSWGYHGSSGKVFRSGYGYAYGPKYGQGAVIGCGVNFIEETAFYTVDGEVIGTSLSLLTMTRTHRFLHYPKPCAYAAPSCDPAEGSLTD